MGTAPSALMLPHVLPPFCVSLSDPLYVPNAYVLQLVSDGANLMPEIPELKAPGLLRPSKHLSRTAQPGGRAQ
jgi:hypothetical protein